MITYVLFGITLAITAFVFYKNRENISDSFKVGESGFSARKLIAFQLMTFVGIADAVYIYRFYKESAFTDRIYTEWNNTHLIYVMFVLGFLSFPEIIKLINTIRGVKGEADK